MLGGKVGDAQIGSGSAARRTLAAPPLARRLLLRLVILLQGCLQYECLGVQAMRRGLPAGLCKVVQLVVRLRHVEEKQWRCALPSCHGQAMHVGTYRSKDKKTPACEALGGAPLRAPFEGAGRKTLKGTWLAGAKPEDIQDLQHSCAFVPHQENLATQTSRR